MPPDLRDRLQASLGTAYAVERELGDAGMSRVFVARETALGRPVVIKVLPPELGGELSAERFKREVTLAARLRHPHIVPVLAAGEAAGLLYYTMPFVEGESLRARLAGAAPSVDETVRILRDVADALGYAHEHGVVHRDLKPANILLEHGHASVTDFGVAKALALANTAGAPNTLTTGGLAVGTPAYMAPEQALADPALDHRADLYALGCVAYESLAGSPPFEARTPQALVAAHLTQSPQPIAERRRDVPAPLAALVMRLLAKRPEDRPSSAAVVVHELEALRTGHGPVSGTRGAARAAIRSRRGRALAVGAGLAIVALAAASMVRPWRLASRAQETAEGGALSRQRVAVAVFDNRTGDDALDPVGSMAADWVTRSLMESSLVDVVDVQTLYARRGDPRAPIDPRAYAARNGAGTLVTGSYYRSADSLYIDATVRDVATGRVRRGIGPVATLASAPVRGVEALGPRVAGALAAELDLRVSEMGRLAGALPTIDAYREFVAGQDAFWREDWHAARSHFAAAARLDTTFLLASAWLAVASAPTADPGLCAQGDSVVRALAPRRHRLELFVQTDLDVVAVRCRGDADGAYRLMRQREQAYPRSTFARMGAATFASFALRSREALTKLRALDPDRDLGWMPPERTQYWAVLTSTYHALGDHGAELDAARAFARRAPAHRIAVLFELRALAALAQDSAVLARLDAEALRPTGEDAGPLAYEIACELLAHGRSAAARAAAARAVAALGARSAGPQGRDAAWTRWELAAASSLVGDDARAAALLRGLASEDGGNVDYRGKLGVLAARRGDRAAAARADAWLAARTPAILSGTPALWRAKIAAASGDRPRAMALMREAIARGVKPLPWLHSDPDLAPLRGDPAFEALFRSRD